MDDAIKVFKALSDETRLRIMRVLLKRSCCVCEIMQALDISQSRASRNLRILKDTGFLKAQSEGLWTVYSVNRGMESPYIRDIIKLLKTAPLSDEVFQQDIDRLARAVRTGPGCGLK